MARKKQPPISDEDREVIGRLLREVRRAAGYRSVEDRGRTSPGCPAARQTIYAYERGGLTPSLAQFLELVEFYVLRGAGRGDGAKPDEDLRAQGVAAVTRALDLPAYHVTEAMELVATHAAGARRGPAPRDALTLTEIDHVGIAVEDLEPPVEHYRGPLGVEPAHRERSSDQGVEEVLFAVGSSYIQLLGALGPDTPVGTVPRKRGPGVHHVGVPRRRRRRSPRDAPKAEGVAAHRRDAEARLARTRRSRSCIRRAMGGVLVELVQESGRGTGPAADAPGSASSARFRRSRISVGAVRGRQELKRGLRVLDPEQRDLRAITAAARSPCWRRARTTGRG